ncbi:MAG: type II toxin-antitoxin system RelE/ParE family toxin [Hyphomonas sp.]
MSLFEVRESLAYLRDLERIEIHLLNTSGNPEAAERRIDEMRAATLRLGEFPRLAPERPDLGLGIRLLTTGEKSVALYLVQEDVRIVLMLRAFYGGEDYEVLVRAENDNT